jgi:uncharacterized protein (TIGR02996 family)
MTDRSVFLNMLAQDEDDMPTRMIYADWLEEHGEYEEADRQRQWPAAKAWLVHLCQVVNTTNSMIAENPSWQETFVSYEQILNLGRQAIHEVEAKGEFQIACAYNFRMSDALNASGRVFWKNWSVVTGIPLPPDMEAKGRFECCLF